ncbi:MAG: DNA polymerase III subunit delta' [Gammaproteobacteria bacterium]
MTVLPWQQETWARMCALVPQGQLSHAWLFVAPGGTGRALFAQALAQYLLCEQPAATSACGTCQSCQWYAAGTHPDSLPLSPEEEGKAIKVDQIRGLIASLALSAHGRQGRRVVIISPAEALNRQAANSLLKSLEEPPANTFFLLLASGLSALPATIRSRCQRLNLPVPDRQQAGDWLAQTAGQGPHNTEALDMADNAPLAALALLESEAIEAHQQLFQAFIQAGMSPQNPIDLAEQWLKQEQYMPIQWLLRWLTVLIKLKQAGGAAGSAYANPDVEALLRALTTEQLFRFYDDALEARRLWSAPLNRRLQLESLFTKWLALFQ